MTKKEKLLKLFTNGVTYNYYIIKTEEPIGHLIYAIKSSSELITDTLEFTSTNIIEELIKKCFVLTEKISPGIFFTEEMDTEKLKEKLNLNFSESDNFSKFIVSIKDEYKIFEIKNYLLYKSKK
jgi:hypothetical protein